MKDTYQAGVAGEEAAERYLRKTRGMVCLERRFRCRQGEIDLIMLEKDTVVFVEVKTRRSGAPGQGLQAVNATKQRRITQACQFYLMRRGWLNRAVRFDLVEIHPEGILHIPNAFQPGGMFYA